MRRISKKLLLIIFLCGVLTILIVSRHGTSGLEMRKKEELVQVLVMKLQAENHDLRTRLSSLEAAGPVTSACEVEAARQLEYQQLQQQARRDQQAVAHELELAPASLFTGKRVFPAEPGTGGRVVEKLTGLRRADLALVIAEATQQMQQRHPTSPGYTFEDFIEGNCRTESATGTHYEMIFKNKTHFNNYLKMYIFRPYAQFQIISFDKNINKRQLVHIILPLSGRVTSFKSFMERFYKISKYDGHIFLTIVYFGEYKMNETKVILNKFKVNNNPRLIVLNETFSRAKALRVGAAQWPEEQDVLLFFCDVDVVFTAHFLERCRWNAAPGRQVYYPIVFSLYNPRVVYELHGKRIPPQNEQLVISKNTGFWRDFGYGMTCQYRSDFEREFESGFERTSWGGEDVALYRKFLRDPRMRVLRSTDSALFHVWHGKQCEPRTMAPAQLRACLRSRARTEASHAQLGLLAFGDQRWLH